MYIHTYIQSYTVCMIVCYSMLVCVPYAQYAMYAQSLNIHYTLTNTVYGIYFAGRKFCEIY